MKSNRRGKKVSSMNRRHFMQGMLAAGAATVLTPRIMHAAANAATPAAPPSRRVNLACIGIGGRGADDVKDLYATGLANIVALCDTDIGAQPTQASLRAHPNAKQFQ